MEREIKFGKIFAIAAAIGEAVLDPNEPGIAEKYLFQFQETPERTLSQIHRELMQHRHKFKSREVSLYLRMDAIFARMTFEEYNEEPLGKEFIREYKKQRNAIGRYI